MLRVRLGLMLVLISLMHKGEELVTGIDEVG